MFRFAALRAVNPLSRRLRSVKPSSHRRQNSKLSCLVGRVNRIGDKSRLLATENFETVSSSLEMRWGLLKTVLTCRQFCSHRRQDKKRQDNLVLSVSVVWTRHYEVRYWFFDIQRFTNDKVRLSVQRYKRQSFKFTSSYLVGKNLVWSWVGMFTGRAEKNMGSIYTELRSYSSSPSSLFH